MNRSVLLKATANDENPTPGYLYGEIAKMTLDGADTSEKVVKVLLERLARNEPAVKLKSLIVIKQTARRGASTFRSAMQQSGGVPAIKQCLQFSGPADPLKGDQPYRAVREAAKEALEAVFDNTSLATPANSVLASRIQGLGNTVSPNDPSSSASSPYDSGRPSSQQSSYPTGGRALPSETSDASRGGSAYDRGFTSNSSDGKYGGIGNPNFRDPRNQPKGFLDRVKERVDEYTETAKKTVESSGVQQWLGNTKGETLRHGEGRNDEYSAGRNEQLGSYSVPVASYSSLPPKSSGPWGPGPSSVAASDPRSPRQSNSSSSYGKTGNATSDGLYERGLIDDLCSRGGLRAVPAREKLSSFLAACKTLEASVVMPVLYEKLLIGEDWKVQHKALCICEALLQAGEDYEAYVDYMDSHAEILEDLQAPHQNPTLRNRCIKVWVLLYGEEAAPAPVDGATSSFSMAAKAKADAAADEDDLLGFDDGSPEPTSKNGASQDVTQKSLFSNLDVKTTPSASSDSDGIFGDLAVKGTISKPAASQTVEPDLLAFSSSSTPASSTVADQLSALSFSESTSASTGAAAKPVTSGSAFSFLAPAAPLARKSSSDNVGGAFDGLLPTETTMQHNQAHPRFQGGAAGIPNGLQPPFSHSGMKPGTAAPRPVMNRPAPGVSQQLYQMHPGNGMPPQFGMTPMSGVQHMPGTQQPFGMPQMQGMPTQTGQPLMYTSSRPMSGPVGARQSSVAQNSKTDKQPDKFDFVSSIMTSMK